MPEALHPHTRRKGVEPTQILKGRRLDALRAEVAQKRKAHRRRQQRVLLLWGLAGGAALCLGWIAGRAFTPDTADDAEPSEAAASELPAAQSPVAARGPKPEAAKERSGEPSGPPPSTDSAARDQSVVSLDDLPFGEEAAPEEPVAAPTVAKQTQQEDEAVEPSNQAAPLEVAPRDESAFTLEDLPAD
jgi:hypothetical protein